MEYQGNVELSISDYNKAIGLNPLYKKVINKYENISDDKGNNRSERALVTGLIDQLQSRLNLSKEHKPNYSELEQFIEQQYIHEIFKILPTRFRSEQTQIVDLLRNIGLICYTKYRDVELTTSILSLCDKFEFISEELKKQLQQDYFYIHEMKNIENMHLFKALIKHDLNLTINSAGIRFGNQFINYLEVVGLSWGIYSETINGWEAERTFSLSVNSDNSLLHIEWNKCEFGVLVLRFFLKYFSRDSEIPISEMSSYQQDVFFRKMIDAVIYFLVPPLFTKQTKHLYNGGTIIIGPLSISKQGISFCVAGFFSKKDRFIDWNNVETEFGQGDVIVRSKVDRRIKIVIPMRTLTNAVMIPMITRVMQKHLVVNSIETLPEVIECPNCESTLELDSIERETKQFHCPACDEFIDYNKL